MYCWIVWKTENKLKRGRVGPFLKNALVKIGLCSFASSSRIDGDLKKFTLRTLSSQPADIVQLWVIEHIKAKAKGQTAFDVTQKTFSVL